MKFTFTKTATINTEAWDKSNAKLEQDLNKLTSENLSESVIHTYIEDMCRALQTVDNDNCKGMLFLMYDAPVSMPADARVEYVYKPTYLAATIMMTAMNRYKNIADNSKIKATISAVLEASTGRNFCGSGYKSIDGMLDTLQIFADGDTMEFIRKFPNINKHFTIALKKALTVLETEICSGKIKDAWSGEDFSEKGKKILELYQNKTEFVWYACYGSNINKSRFMEYIERCSDTTPPIEDRPYSFNHSIYFSKSSGRWHNGGVAFLDDSCNGYAYGRIYKITREQYEDVKRMEGSNYSKKIDLGEIEGLPVYTFTDVQKKEPVRMPSVEYFTTILNGLNDCYSDIFSDEAMTVYLINTIFPENTFRVARIIKESEHYISNEQICELIGSDITTVTDSIEWLVEHNVIQQDRRSISSGHTVNNTEAYFFTVDSPCARGLLKEMINIISGFESEADEEIFEGETEGFRHYMLSSRIERSGRNRLEAIRLHGYKCQVCGFDFEETYGLIGRNYIEVHHVNPLAEQDGEHIVNPETDLVCLCANCHRMIHRNRNSVLSVSKLKNLI